MLMAQFNVQTIIHTKNTLVLNINIHDVLTRHTVFHIQKNCARKLR